MTIHDLEKVIAADQSMTPEEKEALRRDWLKYTTTLLVLESRVCYRFSPMRVVLALACVAGVLFILWSIASRIAGE